MALCRLWQLSTPIIIALCLTVAPVAAQSPAPRPTPVGDWETIDESTHRVKSLVSLTWDGHQLVGRIRKVLDPAAPPNVVCARCAGPRRGQPIEGMIFMWGLTQGVGADVYEGGIVLDPSNGKEYRCRVRLRQDGQLEIRGFVGLPVFGRSQVWRRPNSVQAPPH